VLVLVGSFEQVVAYFFFVSMVFLALSVAAITPLRRKGGPALAYQTPGYPLTPILFIAGIGIVLVLLAVRNPVQSLLGVGVVALGLPLFKVINSRK